MDTKMGGRGNNYLNRVKMFNINGSFILESKMI